MDNYEKSRRSLPPTLVLSTSSGANQKYNAPIPPQLVVQPTKVSFNLDSLFW